MILKITPTPSNTSTNTPTITASETNCPTNSATPTNTATPTFTPTQTQTNTPTPDVTTTPTSTNTPTNTETPTQTATNTPSPEVSTTPTNTQTQTPTNTSTPTFTPTQTNTPSQTGTPNAVCPNQVTVYANTGAFLLPALTYTRLTSYIGGGFTGGYFSTPSNIFTTGTAPNGYTYAVFGAQSGSSYYTLIFSVAGSSQRFNIFVSNTDYVINGGTITQTQLLSNSSGGTDIAGVRFVNPGLTNTGWAWVEYPIACPTPTATATPTQTPSTTQTNTPTPSITPSYTPTQTQTPTTYVDPCLWNTNTDLWNAAAYNWDASCIQPSNTPTVTQTSTPTMTQTQTQTPSGEVICPQELYFENLSPFDYPSGTFTRQTTYTGGTFNGGYLDNTLNNFYPTIAPDGNLYSVFQLYSAGTYYDIMTLFDTGSTPSFIGWVLVQGFDGDTILNGPEYFSSSIGLSTITGTSINGIYFPKAGIQNYYGQNNGNITYSVICPTPTATATPTNTPTCGTYTTQYLKSEQQGNDNIKYRLFDNPNFTGNANAVCDYLISGTYDITNGAINVAYSTTMATNDHTHTYSTGAGNISGFTVSSLSAACPCVNVIFNQITPTPSATPTITPTPSNTATPTNTPTNTATPTSTLSVDYCSYVVVNTQPSLDIPIYDVYVNGVQVTYSSGANWTITPSNSPGTFNTSQTGATQTVAVYYSSNIAGQRIEILDCDEVTQCQNINPGGGIATFTNVAIRCGCYWSVNGYDGTC